MATIITDKAGLQDIDLDLAGDYELANDIDASGPAFTPLGTFTGTLDGKGYKITNLTININAAGQQRGGLFTINNGTIRNLGIENCVISVASTNSDAYVGVFAADNGGTISNCWSSGTLSSTVVSATSWAEGGGIASFNDGTITECNSEVVITCITARHGAGGGLVAINWGTLSESYASGNVIVTSSYVGVNTTYVYAGGLVAYNGTSPFTGTITDFYAMGNATATGGTKAYAGGCIAFNDAGSTATNGYSTGIPVGDDISGGFCALNNGTITDCFWDTEISGTAISDGGTGKTTAQMNLIATFQAWDIALSSIDVNDGYPYLGWQEEESDTWLIYGLSPRRTEAVEDKITLETIRNVEMVAMGRFRVDKEGNAVYRSRYARNV